MHECVHVVCVHLESPSNPGLTLHSALGFAVLVWYIYVQFLSVSPAVEHVSVYVEAGSWLLTAGHSGPRGTERLLRPFCFYSELLSSETPG